MPEYNEIGTIEGENNIHLKRRNRIDLLPIIYETLSWRQRRGNEIRNNRRYYLEQESYWSISNNQTIDMLRQAKQNGYLDNTIESDLGTTVETIIIEPECKDYKQLIGSVLVNSQYDNAWRECNCIAVVCIQANRKWRKVMMLSPENGIATFRSLTSDETYMNRFTDVFSNDRWWLDRSMLDAHPSAFLKWLEFLELISGTNPSAISIDVTIGNDIEADLIEEKGLSKEGSVKEYFGKRYERDPKNRAEAIKHHGLSCKVCKFNFEQTYGERGKHFIEVHHKNPIHTFEGEEQYVNPKEDLVTVCSNCHRIIHRRADSILTIEELIEIILTHRTI
jgi:hypothetical protein